MVSEHVSAQELVPNVIATWWQDSVPMHTLVLIDALRPDGKRGLHAVHDTDAPVWVLIGMLRSVLADLEHRWSEAEWVDYEEDDDD